MKPIRLARTLAAAAILVACSEANSPSPISDNDLLTDLAASSGDAIAADVLQLILNEGLGGFAAPAEFEGTAAPPDSVVHSMLVTHSKVCFGATGAVVPCGPNATSMKITMSMNGTRTGPNFSGAVHRTRTDSVSGLGAGSTTRTHNGFGTSRDTTTFTRDSTTRKAVEAATDSVINLKFQLPRSTHPWPISGQIIRNLNATITITGKVNETRTIARRVVVTFPADAQGNVSIKVGTLTCNLNLVNHKVTGCTG